MSKNKISGFKKFTDLKHKEKLEEAELGIQPMKDSDIPGNPNLPQKTKKTEKTFSKKGIAPVSSAVPSEVNEDSKSSDKDVKMFGKVAKFPKRTKASKAYNFLENVKISKSSIWYILIEKQDNELQMVKYNNKKGFDLVQFVTELKRFYTNKYSDNEKVSKLIESIQINGAEEFSSIGNIPNIEFGGKKLIAIITEDLIKLLSK